MSRVKQSKKEINRELLQKKLEEIPPEKGILSSVLKIGPPIRASLEYINPYVDLVFPDPIKAQIFSYLVIKLREFAFSCQNPDLILFLKGILVDSLRFDATTLVVVLLSILIDVSMVIESL